MKRILTTTQKHYIAETFFKLESYAGWKAIAFYLLGTGECVVAGDNCIWVGGIGNFIKTSAADGYWGCLKYDFDLESFLASNWFKEVLVGEINKLVIKKNAIDEEIDNITSLTF